MTDVDFLDLAGEIQAEAAGRSFFPWRGRLKDPENLLRSFHLLSIAPGHTRGNHAHPGYLEWLYPFHGTGIFFWEAVSGGVQEKEIEGGRTLIKIFPGVGHALKNPGPEILYLLAWREASGDGPRKPEKVERPVSR